MPPIPFPPLELEGVSMPLRAGVLARIAIGLAAAEPVWRVVVRHHPEMRRPVRLLATERYEVWVVGWTADGHSRLHDHGGSTGALVVTAGELTEVVPRDGELVERPLPRGTVRRYPASTVHDVVNRRRGPATSIHVYSPPLTTMTYYDSSALRPTESVTIFPEPPLLTAPGPGPGRLGALTSDI